MIKKSKIQDPVTIAPSFQLPIILIAISFSLLFLKIGTFPTIISASFSFFLLLQSFTLRIKISENELTVLQLGKEIRNFPFKNWLTWKIFTSKIPIIFYFREKLSPHLLPVLFNPDQLRSQLENKVGDLEIKEK